MIHKNYELLNSMKIEPERNLTETVRKLKWYWLCSNLIYLLLLMDYFSIQEVFYFLDLTLIGVERGGGNFTSLPL